jgi:hypothetical protein
MKYTTTITFLAVILWSCNAPLVVSPIEKTAIKITPPDFNFLATSPFDFVYANQSQTYFLPIELYLRPFAGVSDTTSFVFEFGSSKYGQLNILNDALLPGDKIKIQYGDFNKFRLIPSYQSVLPGEHSLAFSVSARGIKKSSTLKINAKN